MLVRFFLAVLLTGVLARSVTAQDDVAEIAGSNSAVVEAYQAGKYGQALDIAIEALEASERVLGPEHPDTLTNVNNLAFLYQATGRYAEAEPLYRRALEARERVLGPEHPDTLTSVNNLAVLYRTIGRYAEAEPLYRRALEVREPVLGPEHPDTLMSVNNLALLYLATGRYAEAEPLLRRAMESSERVLGDAHPQTLTSVNNLAFLYESTGRYAEAEPLYSRALETSERVLGPERPSTLLSVNNLAFLYESTGRYAEAEPLYSRALEARERLLGEEHPDTLMSVNNLAFLYQATGRYAEAEPLLRRALEARERLLGEEHPDTLGSVSNLAFLYQATARYAEAEPLLRRALEASERVLGPEHPDTLGSVSNLAGLYLATGRYAEAEPLLRRALEAHERVLGDAHPQTLLSVNNLAFLYESTGRHAEAEPLYRRALETSERVLGDAHPQTLTSVNNLAGLYQRTRSYAEAEPLYRRALEASERVLGPEHPQTIDILGNLSILMVRTDRPEDALQALRQIDLRLGQWLDVEVTTTRAAARRRRILLLNSTYQNLGFSLAITAPSEASADFAADLALKWKKRLAQDDAILNNIARENDEPALIEAIEAVKDSRRALSNAAFDESVSADEKSRLTEDLEAAEAELRARSDKYRRFIAAKTATADDIGLTLTGDAALIEFRLFDPYDFETASYGETRLLAVAMRADDAPVVVDLGEAVTFTALYAYTVNATFREAEGVSFAALMRDGHDRLIAPLLPHLEGIRTLYIAPDGPLGAVPFEAFQDEAGRRLVESHAVRMLQTGRDLVGRDRRAPGKGLVAFGGVDFGEIELAERAEAPQAQPQTEVQAAIDATQAQFKSFRPLDATLQEVNYIGDAYAAYRPDEPEPVVLTGEDATEGALKSLAEPPRVLHFATHGYYLASGSVADRPLLQSGITLAGANRALRGLTGDDRENGILHAVEAQTLNLYGTELVVLSACDTGQGALDYSEGLEGLPRAFYVAGAQNVLAALWPVGDNSAREFMKRFYENWLSQEVSDPAAAVRQTKRWYLTQRDPGTSDPENWAPFVLFEG